MFNSTADGVHQEQILKTVKYVDINFMGKL